EKTFSDSAKERGDDYWEDNRAVALTNQEKDIYTMVKRVEEHPAFKLRKNIIEAIWTGYYPKKYIDLGDMYTFYSYNQVEYSRFKLAFRTNETLFENTTFQGFAAYGMRDEKFKYGGWTDHVFRGQRNRALRVGGGY